MKRFTIVFYLLSISALAPAQKYNFVNWTVEDGLLQSQASFICQDNYRQLWIGTEGGLCSFDGKKFKSYTVQDGLPANQISCLLNANGQLFVGSRNGLAAFDGKHFSKLNLHQTQNAQIRNLARSGQKVFVHCNFSVFLAQGADAKQQLVTGDSTERITTLFGADSVHVLAAVYAKGLYAFDGKSWRKRSTTFPEYLFVYRVFVSTSHDTLLATNTGLLVMRNGQPVQHNLAPQIPQRIPICIAEDENQNIWVGTEKGAFRLSPRGVTVFEGQSGLTDNAVSYIYRDLEDNLWFATNADGIYKFRENTFTYFDRSSGLDNPIVMGVVQTPDKRIYAAGYGGGLYEIGVGGALEPVKGADKLRDHKINCLFAGSDNTVWIGVLNKGVFSYSKQEGLMTLKPQGDSHQLPGATAFFEDKASGALLIGTAQGCFVKSREGKLTWIEYPQTLVTSFQLLSDGSLLMGTTDGLYTLDAKYTAKPVGNKELARASVMCLAHNGSHLYVGTSDKGIYTQAIQDGTLSKYDLSDGLPSNFIYSIDAGTNGRIWAGTGFGISKIDLADNQAIKNIKNYGRSDGLLGMECNHNSLLHAADGSLWFGTTKGLFHFDPEISRTRNHAPLVLLRSVKLFSSPIADSNLYQAAGTWFDVPKGLKLFNRQNHLSFELGSIYYTNPDDVQYSYMLEGIDHALTVSSNPFIVYPSLPPGKYVLKVKGFTKSGVASMNEIAYPFEIRKAFYQTAWFRFIVIMSLIGTGALIAFFIIRARQKRKQREKELHAKIREEEFMKLRQRTAEDFHDELGNSLTRITVLADVLTHKLNGHGQEVGHLVDQIKANTASLYKGSRDIIWSLNSKNDGLYEIAEHIKDIGNEVFQDTTVDFDYKHNIDPGTPLKLKLDYSRNLTMIFKEAYNNVLKHAHANKVQVELDLQEPNVLIVNLQDNGNGFESNGYEKGNGLRNMKNRVSRMQGRFEVQSGLQRGTRILIRLDNIFIN